MLPKNGTPWPPHSRHTEQVAEWSAWYSGDPQQLRTFYGPRTGVTNRANQFRGGVVGTLARWWWGQPVPDGEQATKLHVPLAADICGTSADLLFSEPLGLSAGTDSMTEFLAELQENGLETKLHEGAEVGSALGGTYLRCVWDSEVSPLPWTSVCHPDGAVPEFRHGRLSAVTLWSELSTDKTTVWRLLERHEPGFIVYGLYAGTASNLGTIQPLAAHSATADLAPLVNKEGAQATGTQRLTVTYVPNMMPNRVHRRSNQGRSDLQGIEPWLDSLDEAYDSWLRDIRLGKARLHVPEQYLESTGPGQGATVNLDRELYVPVGGTLAKSGDGLLIDATQFKIRYAEHAQTCQDWTKQIVESAGYSTQSLTGDSGGAVTAAEVHSHERRSYMTRGKKIRYWTQGLRDHLQALAEVANANLSAGIDVDMPKIEFSDGVQDSAMSLAQTANALRAAKAASTDTLVRMVNPDWDDKEVADEVAKILAEDAIEPLPIPQDAGL